MRPTLELHEHLISAAESLEPLPAAAVRLAEAVNSPETDPEAVAAILGTDPALAAHVLRDANSAAEGAQARIGSLEQAVVRLGAARILEIALRGHLADHLAADLAVYEMSGEEHRRHAVGASIAAEVIVRKTPLPVSRDVLCAALLHDLGKEIIDTVADPAMSHSLRCDAIADIELEREIVEADHTEIGALVLETWHLPATLVDAVRHHHAPAHSPEAATVCLAEAICRDLLPADSVDAAIDEDLVNEAAAALALSESIGEVRSDIEAALSRSGVLNPAS